MDLPVWIMLGLGLGGIVAVIGWMAFMTVNKPNSAAEITRQLWIVFGVVGSLIVLFGAASYIYFTANTNYLTPFLLVMNFVNLFLSLFAMSAATLNVTSE